jgi:hypothetical protein
LPPIGPAAYRPGRIVPDFSAQFASPPIAGFSAGSECLAVDEFRSEIRFVGVRDGAVPSQELRMLGTDRFGPVDISELNSVRALAQLRIHRWIPPASDRLSVELSTLLHGALLDQIDQNAFHSTAANPYTRFPVQLLKPIGCKCVSVFRQVDQRVDKGE